MAFTYFAIKNSNNRTPCDKPMSKLVNARGFAIIYIIECPICHSDGANVTVLVKNIDEPAYACANCNAFIIMIKSTMRPIQRSDIKIKCKIPPKTKHLFMADNAFVKRIVDPRLSHLYTDMAVPDCHVIKLLSEIKHITKAPFDADLRKLVITSDVALAYNIKYVKDQLMHSERKYDDAIYDSIDLMRLMLDLKEQNEDKSSTYNKKSMNVMNLSVPVNSYNINIAYPDVFINDSKLGRMYVQYEFEGRNYICGIG